MRKVLLGWVVGSLVLGLLGQPAYAESLVVRVDGQLRGQLSVIMTEEGAAYVSLDLLAHLLGVRPRWDREKTRAVFKLGEQTVRLTRDRVRVLVHAKPVTLSAPPRVLKSGWAVPEEFLTELLPRILPGVTVVRASAAPAEPEVKAAHEGATLEDLRVRSYPSFTRVVLEGSGRFDASLTRSSEPGEIRVVLSGLRVDTPRTAEVADGLVHGLKLERRGREVALTIDLESPPAETRTLVLEEPFRLVLDLYRLREAPAAMPSPPVQPLRFIVLDPGHGGRDTGAISPRGLEEKDVVLDVVKRLARMLEERLGIRVALTRTRDTFVPLKERTTFANAQGADLFVSIHANAHRSTAHRGVETYFLSSEASDDEARQVAALENRVIQLEGPASRTNKDVLKTILWDLAQSEFMEESSRLAETVLDSLARSLKMANRGVKQAGFYVLGGAAMPAILVEIGFLTNRKEEQRLMSSSHREGVARAIYVGLADYKRAYDRKRKVSPREGSR
ncbi:MAG: N-acetylmuramoyl-L-alanine amidase [Candidatus Methylomirabilia bacterium]